MKLTDAKHVFVVGLGGVGVSAIAKFLLAQGQQVSGSDPQPSPLIDDVVRAGGRYCGDARAENITSAIDFLVYTDASPNDHPERQRAELLGLPTLGFASALGEIMDPYQHRVAIAGTNGKSTTAALTGLLLTDAGLDPTVFVGSRVQVFDGNLRIGASGLFVAEADEYRNHFFELRPTVLTITNIEFDHPDFFPNLAAIQTSFARMVDRLQPSDALIINADDPWLHQTWGERPGVVTFGQSAEAHLRWSIIQAGPGHQSFHLTWRGQDLGLFTLQLPGTFNIANAAAALATALVCGAPTTTLAATVAKFTGIWRRFERLAESPYIVINDYAHHPTAIAGTIAGARDFYPQRRLVVIFQPHHHQRLTALFDDFVRALASADIVIMAEVYGVLGREQRAGMKTSSDVVAALAVQGRPVSYAPDPQTAVKMIRQTRQPGDVLLIMGAGDIWTLGQDLANDHGD